MINVLIGQRVAYATTHEPNQARHGIFLSDDDDFICIDCEDGPLAGAAVFFQLHAFLYIRSAP